MLLQTRVQNWLIVEIVSFFSWEMHRWTLICFVWFKVQNNSGSTSAQVQRITFWVIYWFTDGNQFKKQMKQQCWNTNSKELFQRDTRALAAQQSKQYCLENEVTNSYTHTFLMNCVLTAVFFFSNNIFTPVNIRGLCDNSFDSVFIFRHQRYWHHQQLVC